MIKNILKSLLLSLFILSFSNCKKKDIATGKLIIYATLNKNGTNIGPREGINITLDFDDGDHTQSYKYTNLEGKCTFNNLTPGFYHIRASYEDQSNNGLDYYVETNSFEIKNNKTRNKDIVLSEF